MSVYKDWKLGRDCRRKNTHDAKEDEGSSEDGKVWLEIGLVIL